VIIRELELWNFRRFGQLSVDFHPELTVIVARNGQGKTSVLDGITVALGTFVGAFDLGKAQHIEKSDARLARASGQPEGEAQYPVKVGATFSQPHFVVHRELTGPKNKTTIRDANAITEYGTQLQQMVRAGEQAPLPLVSYYGAGRLWKVHKNIARKQVVSASRTMGYEDCLSPASNFVQCQQWMAKATFAHLQEQAQPPEQRLSVSMGDRLAAIQDAVNFVLTEEGWSDFSYSMVHEEVTMSSPEAGRLPVSLLSDGVRAMVSMVADIAFRCVRLNGYLGREAARQTQGIVLIDEVDIHLHPAWQQRVIHTLRLAFPRLQFIVTTHSPQVLTSVDASCIRQLTGDIGPNADQPAILAGHVSQQTRGVASSDLLARIMGVDPIPDVPEARWVSDYHTLILQNRFQDQEGLALRDRLTGHFGFEHPVMLECDRLIRLQSYRTRMRQGRGPA
jgi:predicted ATP-binding protein involved in virulence